MKKALILLLCMMSLTGCVPTALVLGATAGGAILYDKRSVKTMVRDRDITQTAQNRLNKTPDFKDNTHISVATIDGIALMVGQANTPALRDEAYQIVSTTPHVKKVFNQVTIGKPIGFGRQTDDTWITTKIRAALLAKSGLNSTQVKVVTENGVAYLLGILSEKQAKLAADATRRVSGVKKVVEVFEYT